MNARPDAAGSMLRSSGVPLAQAYDVGLLDLDGVVYIGPQAVPGAAAALGAAAAAGMRLVYVTNNASRPPEAVSDHLRRLGVDAGPHDVVTSAQAAAHLLAGMLPAGAPVLVVGGEGLQAALQEEGLRAVTALRDGPQAVVQGFSPDVGWRQLAEGAHAVRSGLPWVVTNLDLTVPTERGTAPGNGTLVAAVRAAVDVDPVVAGKPEPALFAEAVRRCGARRPLVVGDRLDTDLAGANRAGYDGLLVLTGVTTVSTLLEAAPLERPTYVGADLSVLVEEHPGVVRADRWWSCRSAAVSVDEQGRVKVRGHGTDVLRAACAAAWSALDDAAPVDLTALAIVVDRSQAAGTVA